MRFRRLGSFATIAIAGAVLVPLLHAQQGTQPSVTAVRQATTMAGRFGLTYTDVRIESLPDRQVRITLTKEGRALKKKAQCIPHDVLCASGQSHEVLQDLREKLSSIRDDLAKTNS